MQQEQQVGLYQPETIADALGVLSELGPRGSVLAGGTWIMRAPLRHEQMVPGYVAISRIPELHQVEVTDDHVKVGCGVTHTQLARALEAMPQMRGLVAAAGDAANPAIRQAATVGGNLCSVDFQAADLVPALLCQGAEVELAASEGRQRMALGEFLEIRGTLQPGSLLLHVLIPRRDVISAHARLPLRKAGDYPVTIVSAAVERGADGTIGEVAIAVGSVEETARRWGRLEQAISGLSLDPDLVHQHAVALADEFTGREGPEVPGWYRVQVLPTLVRRVFEKLQNT